MISHDISHTVNVP